jgi:hypothetical protein
MPNLDISVERQNLDGRSSEIQCKLTIRNGSETNIRLLSVRVSNAVGAEVQQVLDSDLTRAPKQLQDIYRDLDGSSMAASASARKEGDCSAAACLKTESRTLERGGGRVSLMTDLGLKAFCAAFHPALVHYRASQPLTSQRSL